MSTLPLLPYYYFKRRQAAKRRKAEDEARLKAELEKDQKLLEGRKQHIATFGKIGAEASSDLLEVIPGQEFYSDLQDAFTDFVAANPSNHALLDFDKLNLAMLFIRKLPQGHPALDSNLSDLATQMGKLRPEVNRAVAELLSQSL